MDNNDNIPVDWDDDNNSDEENDVQVIIKEKEYEERKVMDKNNEIVQKMTNKKLIEPKERLFKTKMCLNVQNNNKCTRKNCSFAHSRDELRPAECMFGENCRLRNCKFIHTIDNKNIKKAPSTSDIKHKMYTTATEASILKPSSLVKSRSPSPRKNKVTIPTLANLLTIKKTSPFHSPRSPGKSIKRTSWAEQVDNESPKKSMIILSCNDENISKLIDVITKCNLEDVNISIKKIN